MSTSGVKATVKFVSEDLFLGVTPSGHAMVLDTDSQRSSASSPVELLLVALGSCTATDVASILSKKRQQVTSYVIEVTVSAARASLRRTALAASIRAAPVGSPRPWPPPR